MMTAQMRNPVERCSADGVEIAATLQKGNRMAHSTVSTRDPEAAFIAGYTAYPFSFEVGRHAAQLWLSDAKPLMSLADFRENRWRAFSAGCDRGRDEHQAFSDGFSKALADHIAGVNHG